MPVSGWHQVSCGDGSKAPWYYDWALIATTSPDRHLLVRRSLTPDGKGKRELAFFTSHAPAGTTLAELVTVAGTQVGGRGMLPGRRERDRPGPLPGPPL